MARGGPDTVVARPGDWVLVYSIVLPPGGRAPAVPPETQAVPLEMRVKGFLVDRAAGRAPARGDVVTVRTLSGRLVAGTLLDVNPVIPPTFGSPVAELLAVGPELRGRLGGGSWT
ncbi:MAG: 2-amino-4-ketopentanoate thiolase [Bacillota bacterium]|nr:MAG: 2-amino-4-ketopentanoate thiolase [Bacillota bacterium]